MPSPSLRTADCFVFWCYKLSKFLFPLVTRLTFSCREPTKVASFHCSRVWQMRSRYGLKSKLWNLKTIICHVRLMWRILHDRVSEKSYLFKMKEEWIALHCVLFVINIMKLLIIFLWCVNGQKWSSLHILSLLHFIN